MDESRRGFMAMGATLAAGAVLPAHALAADAPGATPRQNLVATTDLRLATFSMPGEPALRTGAVLDDGRIIDLAREAKARGTSLSFDPASMISLIAGGDAALKQVRALTQGAQGEHPKIGNVSFASPIPVPQRNIYAVGWNYLAHFKEGAALRDPNQKYPEHPVFFSKAQHCMNGPFSPIPFDRNVSTMIDWEGELAVIIGRRGRNIPEASAMDYVFGFSVINDTTARDLQQTRHGGQWFKGKSLDGHGPMGPWIVTRGALNHDNLKLQTRINGVVRQDANTGQMFFKVPAILAELSMGLTLEPGDIIATGTPPGVGNSMKPPMYLKPGDIMETEISGIGVIRNEIQAVS
jgi:2-keto-4-pentenoate hydratase/2-oxohepta-3-ene-1,7-dioic acid hydratase in catechol pathway